jgi:hypothetical protein
MFSRVRIAIRFFFVGLAVGVLLAPRKGSETRRLLRARADRLLNDVLDAATLGTYESGAEVADELDDEPSKRAPRDGRSRRAGSTVTPSAAQA